MNECKEPTTKNHLSRLAEIFRNSLLKEHTGKTSAQSKRILNKLERPKTPAVGLVSHPILRLVSSLTLSSLLPLSVGQKKKPKKPKNSKKQKKAVKTPTPKKARKQNRLTDLCYWGVGVRHSPFPVCDCSVRAQTHRHKHKHTTITHKVLKRSVAEVQKLADDDSLRRVFKSSMTGARCYAPSFLPPSFVGTPCFELHEKSQLFEMEIIEWKNHKKHKLHIGNLAQLFDSCKYVGEESEEGGEKSLLQRCTVSLSLRPPLFASFLVFLDSRTYRTAGLRVGILL